MTTLIGIGIAISVSYLPGSQRAIMQIIAGLMCGGR